MTTIDQYLHDQERRGATFLATIAPVAGDSELVRLTPYLTGRCACDHAIQLRKQDVELEPTVHTAECCGKELHVFRVHIKVGAQISAVDHVRYVLRATTPAAAARPAPADGAGDRLSDCARSCRDGFRDCVEAARDDDEARRCSEGYSWCLEDCRPPPREDRLQARSGGAARTCDCAALYAMLSDLQDQLAHAPPGRKSSLLRQIARLRERLESCGC
jgi:hypothetical protein